MSSQIIPVDPFDCIVFGGTGDLAERKLLPALYHRQKDGQITEPYSISAGLDYPGVGPMHAHFCKTGRAEFISITDDDAMKAGLELCKLEGIIPAIETSHALAIFDHENFKKDDVIVVNLSGRGDKDLNTYINYFDL